MHSPVVLLPQPRRFELKPSMPVSQTGLDALSIVVRREASLPPQGYRLETGPRGIELAASDDAGAFYAQQTLAQLSRNFPEGIPPLLIEDWPDFPVRGVMLDISRDKVPTMQSLFDLVDQLAKWKINQLQLYTVHTFAYRGHEVVWKDASPMTAEEIQQLDRYCRERFIELVPNQNSFGHLERWFKHPEYQHLAEQPDGFTFPSGVRMPTGFSLNPLDPQSLEFVEGLYHQLLPNFSSRLFNVGCDETLDIGLGRSKAEVERRGRERVYLDFLLKIHHAVSRRGSTMMFWGDIILNKPELIGELPRDLIALNWGYEADHPFEKETQAFKDAGVPFYVCPGTSSWCSISGRSDNAIANLRNAAEHGLKNGAIGYLITDWGDYGHLQYLPISYPGFAAGAAFSWCLQTNRDIDLQAALDLHCFADEAHVMAQLLHRFGNVYQSIREPMSNGSRLFWALIDNGERKRLYERVTLEEYRQAEHMIDAAIGPLPGAAMGHPDRELITAEICNAAAMLRCACKRGRLLCGDSSVDPESLASEIDRVIATHRRLWLARNRRGGLEGSIARLETLAQDLRGR